jgi:hypothetical protein
VTRNEQPVTDLAERFQTAPPAVRIAVVRALDAIVGFSKSTGSLRGTAGIREKPAKWSGSAW